MTDDAITDMLSRDGFWVLGDERHPKAYVPIVVQDGRIYSMLLDEVLNPRKFLPTAIQISGPHGPGDASHTQLDALRQIAVWWKSAQARGATAEEALQEITCLAESFT